jgi:hypothetical protein
MHSKTEHSEPRQVVLVEDLDPVPAEMPMPCMQIVF